MSKRKKQVERRKETYLPDFGKEQQVLFHDACLSREEVKSYLLGS
jgi:hypothetical protein